MMKFKVGDRVYINGEENPFVGAYGTIEFLYPDSPMEYDVRLDDRNLIPCHESELIEA